jgi:kumamolisin
MRRHVLGAAIPAVRRRRLALFALAAAAVLVLASGPRIVHALHTPQSDGVPGVIDGPLAWLLASSVDLGPAQRGQVELIAALADPTRPDTLIGWAKSRGLLVNWRPGDNWAAVEGAPARVAEAFGVAVHDYRSRSGPVFYASAQQPLVPAPVRGEVTALGRLLGYRPLQPARPPDVPLDVPKGGLTPGQLLAAYDASPLTAAGFTGRGQTIVFLEGDGYDQADLDSYAEISNLPRFVPTLIGGNLGKPEGETTMDLEVAHAIAPDAQLVILAVPRQFHTYKDVADVLQTADQRFPGAVWSSSVGWGCDRMDTAADLAPLRTALSTAAAHGTSAFDASGDSAGYECKNTDDWSAPPGASDQGLDSMASLPEMTDVGGTTLSTDADGVWVAEETWVDSPMSQGTGGGVSNLFGRPTWQNAVAASQDTTRAHRLTPDVAADADPFTGVRIVVNHKRESGGGTSQAAPIWAALTALMNQYLVAHGGHVAGAMNPLLYRVAAGAARPAFHDVTVAGNAVYMASPGYDLVSGLGTPDVNNLVQDLLDIQTGH